MKSTNRILLAVSLAILPCAAGAQAVVTERSISRDAARELANTALE